MHPAAFLQGTVAGTWPPGAELSLVGDGPAPWRLSASSLF